MSPCAGGSGDRPPASAARARALTCTPSPPPPARLPAPGPADAPPPSFPARAAQSPQARGPGPAAGDRRSARRSPGCQNAGSSGAGRRTSAHERGVTPLPSRPPPRSPPTYLAPPPPPHSSAPGPGPRCRCLPAILVAPGLPGSAPSLRALAVTSPVGQAWKWARVNPRPWRELQGRVGDHGTQEAAVVLLPRAREAQGRVPNMGRRWAGGQTGCV